ncbi:coiled-coil domain-containing protein 43 [Pararge aegeria]|uniref:Coiled-coil domain-containing protein 43 n=2 Tax=Pararge aegeria TaxID=116150 RepID=A0A8S4RR05_9NEOP|nr:coiled-coil domain-containing protein 43 [Pararge aegeria]CAH2240584.1 jg21058 [Pararge aegeria aegeria]
MATAVLEFEPWLIDKLKSLKTDEGVFGSYISGILESEESIDEKKDALEGILSEIVERDITIHVNEIIDKWELCKPKEEITKPKDVDIQLAKLLESQSLATTSRREYTDEEKKIREAILSQYSQLSDNEEDKKKAEEPDCQDLVKNTNALDVAAAAKERREQGRLEAQRKKEKDKEDREKQKALKEEKKEKRKTLKVERKR